MPCLSPFYVTNSRLTETPVPCGRCPSCLNRRINDWVFRLTQERKVSTTSYFVTLTYNNDNVPISENGFMTLDKPDVQKFMKRLRKRNQSKIKYFAVGEYGSLRKRPHYHMIIFNVDDKDYIRQSWKLGTVDIGTVSTDSIAYTLKYLDKGKIIPQHSRDDRLKEFSLMSKGLGADFMTQAMVNFYQNDISRIYILSNGHKRSMPRYYRKKIFDAVQRDAQMQYINDLMEQQEEEAYQRFCRKYASHSADLDDLWIVYKDLLRNQQHVKHYSQQKPRDFININTKIDEKEN
jgi:hypothetical protein